MKLVQLRSYQNSFCEVAKKGLGPNIAMEGAPDVDTVLGEHLVQQVDLRIEWERGVEGREDTM